MIKATAMARGKPVVILGLSHENLARLVSNEPIHFNGSEVGIPGIGFIIMAGKDEADIIEQLKAVERG